MPVTRDRDCASRGPGPEDRLGDLTAAAATLRYRPGPARPDGGGRDRDRAVIRSHELPGGCLGCRGQCQGRLVTMILLVKGLGRY